MGIFKAYDIRGIYGSEIDTDLSYGIGRSIARVIAGAKLLIGHDARIHSGSMYHALCVVS